MFQALEEVLSEQFKKKGNAVVAENVGIARAGYQYGASNFKPFAWALPMTENRYAVLSGNVAMAMGGAAAGVKFYCAYPMSPSTGVLHWMAAHARKAGIMVRQVEDEIGVVNMAIGASHAGVRSMCSTWFVIPAISGDVTLTGVADTAAKPFIFYLRCFADLGLC